MADLVQLFTGRPGAVEVVTVRSGRRVRGRWWRLPGSRVEHGPHRTVFDAVLDVAHACQMSGQRADFREV
jgi:hypothetical protein